jgi:hypothetical protein
MRLHAPQAGDARVAPIRAAAVLTMQQFHAKLALRSIVKTDLLQFCRSFFSIAFPGRFTFLAAECKMK